MQTPKFYVLKKNSAENYRLGTENFRYDSDFWSII